MADNMTLVYVKETGHVVGALMRRSSGVTDTVADLVGDAFEIHDTKTGDTVAHIGADALDVAVVAMASGNRDALFEPSSWGVDDKKVPASLADHPTLTPSISASATGVTITNFPLVSTPRKVWVQVENDKGFRAQQTGHFDTVSSTQPTQTLVVPFRLAAGTYRIVTLVQGLTRYVDTATVP